MSSKNIRQIVTRKSCLRDKTKENKHQRVKEKKFFMYYICLQYESKMFNYHRVKTLFRSVSNSSNTASACATRPFLRYRSQSSKSKPIAIDERWRTFESHDKFDGLVERQRETSEKNELSKSQAYFCVFLSIRDSDFTYFHRTDLIIRKVFETLKI